MFSAPYPYPLPFSHQRSRAGVGAAGGGGGGSSSGHPSNNSSISGSVGGGGGGGGGGGSGSNHQASGAFTSSGGALGNSDADGGILHHAKLLYPGDTAFATRLLAGVKAGKGEAWARCECHSYTQGLVNLALDRESELVREISASGPLLKVSGYSWWECSSFVKTKGRGSVSS